MSPTPAAGLWIHCRRGAARKLLGRDVRGERDVGVGDQPPALVVVRACRNVSPGNARRSRSTCAAGIVQIRKAL